MAVKFPRSHGNSKKGFLYSFVALLIVIMFILMIGLNSKARMKEKTFIMSKTIKSLDNKFSKVFSDIERGTYIIGFRALIETSNLVSHNSSYADSIFRSFPEIFINGTYNGTQLALMNGTSFNYYSANLENVMAQEGYDLDIQLNNLTIQHSDPWHVMITLNLSMYFTDPMQTAVWNGTYSVSRDILITELEDPLYSVNSNGLVHNQIIRTNVTGFVSGNNTHNLSVHLNNSFYIENTNAPSYLMRLVNNLSPSLYGIESLVNIEDFKDQGLSVKNKTVVDYIYFSNIAVSNETEIQYMPDWFILDYDDDHVGFYEAGGIIE